MPKSEQVTVATQSGTPSASAAERADQRNALLAGFLGWTLDAFDFFILTLVIEDVARAFGRTRPEIALAVTASLAMRPVGAVVFGIMADHWGRRLPLMLNVVFYAVISVLSGLAPSYGTFLALRLLFGVGMGGEWGVGASLALESAPPRLRGLLSGLLQEGYAVGNLLAALALRTLYPVFVEHYGADAWRAMFFLGGLPALLSLFIRAKVKDPPAWREHKMDWPAYVRSLPAYGKRFLYLVAMMTMMNLISHGTQDMYPTLLARSGYDARRIADVTMLSMVGAVLGGLAFGAASDRFGRRSSMATAMALGLGVLPLWLAGAGSPAVLVGVFCMQFFVQGAWGVVPAHINELSPGHLRGFLPGVAYQLGVLFASSIPYVESTLGEIFGYTQAMGGLVGAAFTIGIVVILCGPEARGASFRTRDATRAPTR